jgi:hypothetical protein
MDNQCQGCGGVHQVSVYEILKFDPATAQWICAECQNDRKKAHA